MALAGAIGFGLANKQQADAVSFNREWGRNAMMKGGAANKDEYVKKLQSNATYARHAANFHPDFKLTKDQYSEFAKRALQCYAYKVGKIECKIHGKWQTVLKDTWSVGHDWKHKSWKHKIGKDTVWATRSRDVFLSDKIPVLVHFNKHGEVQYAALNPCGNQMGGEKVKAKAECKSLSKKKVGLNKYEFTTKVHSNSLAKVTKVSYYLDGKKIGESSKSSDSYKITHTITGSGTVTAEVHVTLPGGYKITITDKDCKEKVTYEAPFYKCDLLVPSTRNEEETEFRFTVKTSQGNGAELENVDFNIWKKSNPGDVTTVEGVTQKDENGDIYYQTEFPDDGEARVVEAVVNFNIANKVVSDKCKAEVTPKQQPKCPIEGKENLSPNDEECQQPKCPYPGKENLDKKDDACEEPEEPAKELPKTGAAGLLGIFGSATGAGAAAHRLIARRRNK
jgi:hypothetical protein